MFRFILTFQELRKTGRASSGLIIASNVFEHTDK